VLSSRSVKLRLRRLPFVLVLVVLGGIGAMARLDRPARQLEARWAEPPSSFINLEDGLRVHIRDRGEKGRPALVLIHGSVSSLFTWEAWSKDLSRDLRVITLDLQGHGLTGPHPRELYSIDDMAATVHGVTTKLGLERFSLGGSSMGGHVALAYALAHPDRVEKLVLVDPAGLPREEPPRLVMRMAAWPVVGHVFSIVTPRFVIADSVRDAYGDPAKVTEALIDQYYDFILREGNRRASRLRLSSPSAPLDPARLAALKMPVLILWGAKDRWILPKYGERLRDAIPGSRLVVFDNLGHVPMEEDPQGSVVPVRELLVPPGAR
jgi:pimeloyl-ACP methyl ester carboxylesterase